MIVSHKHKFIFLKTNKTAGTSVEIALSRFCGADDILSPVTPVDEEKRKREGYRGAQNYAESLPPGRALVNRLLRRPVEKRKFYNHMPAQELMPLLDESVWKSYYKFCIERNPWDRAVSAYFWRGKPKGYASILDWLHDGGHQILIKRGRGIYTVENEMVVDRVVRFENLAGGLEDVRAEIGLPDPLELPRAKSGHRKDKRPYSEILGNEERRIIERDFAFEIETFGYTF